MPPRYRPVSPATGVLSSPVRPNRDILIRALRQLPKRAWRHPDYALIQKLETWARVPTCLWPIGLDTIGIHATAEMRRGRPLDAHTRLALQVLATPPPAEARAAAGRVGAGRSILRSHHKFAAVQEDRRRCHQLAREWRQIKAAFELGQYRDSRGMIRYEFTQDQDLRMEHRLDWNRVDLRFRTVFNAFCSRWHLRGIRGDNPVLLKPQVRLTPVGTMIFVPAYWSLDHQRDFFWREIRALHHSRSLSKQGAKFNRNQAERRKVALLAKRLMARARAMGLKGSRRDDWVMRGLNWDVRTDPKTLWRILHQTP